MRLSDILGDVPRLHRLDADDRRDPDILTMSQDSRQVTPGTLFVAAKGVVIDGRRYMAEAVRNGAAAILSALPPETAEERAAAAEVPVLSADPFTPAVGETADLLWGHPSRDLALMGVTGTNGKTTTAYLLRHIFRNAGKPCGMLGTIEYDNGEKLRPASLTTPGAVAFTRALAEMRDNGCMAAAVETSSHALDQDRVHPHRFSVAVFTNLTRDHLDYHGDMAAYGAAKKKLFDRLDTEAAAVVNADDAAAADMLADCPARLLAYTLTDTNDPLADGGTLPLPKRTELFRASVLSVDLSGSRFSLTPPVTPGDPEPQTIHAFIPLVGRHNVQNALGAWLAARALGLDDDTIIQALSGFPGVPGRLERFTASDRPTAFVDYAHTDDALRSVLSILRALTPGRLWVVFGCGGDRDPGKRPLMGRVAESFADRVVVTSDNPRTEKPDRIIEEIFSGFVRPDQARREPDRAAAIAYALGEAEPGDVVLIAGKGHEDYQIIGTAKHHFDDREVVRNALEIEE